MKCKVISKKQFKPIILELTIETEEDYEGLKKTEKVYDTWCNNTPFDVCWMYKKIMEALKCL